MRGEVGELVITKPMPSMPIAFWNDADGSRYRAAYFEMFPGVWRHGDWITITDHGSIVVHGRSDSTLNRHGIRMGSADIYQAVERLPEIAEALVIGAEQPDGGYWMPLFVVLADGAELTDELQDRIKRHHPRRGVAAARSRRDHRGSRHSAHPHRQEARGADQEAVRRAATPRRSWSAARSTTPRCWTGTRNRSASALLTSRNWRIGPVMGEATRDESTSIALRLLAVGELYARRAVQWVERGLWSKDSRRWVAAEISAVQNIGHARAVGQVSYGRTLRDRLPSVARVFVRGTIDMRLVLTIIGRTENVEDTVIARVG